MKKTLILIALALTLPLGAQNLLSEAEEDTIKLSGRYFWNECAAFEAAEARECAYTELSKLIVQEAVRVSINSETLLSSIQGRIHFDQLPQRGKVKMIAWIEKDSVSLTLTRSLAAPAKEEPVVEEPVVEEPVVEKPVAVEHFIEEDMDFVDPAVLDDPILDKLSSCKTEKEMRQVARANGLVSGYEDADFANPANCYVVVLRRTDRKPVAILDRGDGARLDVYSGNMISDFQQVYNLNNYILWYLLQK